MKKRTMKDSELISKVRAMLAMEQDSSCPCTMTECEWHGQCYECVRIHRCFADRVPACLQTLGLNRGRPQAQATKKLTKVRQAKLIDAYWEQIRKMTAQAERLVAPRQRRTRQR